MSWTFIHSPNFLARFLHTTTCFEIPVHMLGVYCILFQTPASMRSVKRNMLNLHLWSVVLDLGVSLLTTPFVLFPAIAGFPLGLLKEFGVPTAIQIWIIVYMFASASVAIVGIFENRYFLLLPHIKNSRWRHYRIVFFVTLYLFAFVFFLPPYLHIPEQTSAVQHVLELLPETPDYIRRLPIFVLSIDVTYIFWSVLFFTILICAACLFFTLTLTNWLRRQMTVSKRTANMQKTFLIAMHIQICVPMIVILFPLLYIGFSVYFTVHNQAVNNIAIVMMSLHGLFSTPTMLMSHQPYRNFCRRMICPKKGKKPGQLARVISTRVTAN